MSQRHFEVKWIDYLGNPTEASREMAANAHLAETVKHVLLGETLCNVANLSFRDPDSFRAEEFHQHLFIWQDLVSDNLSKQQWHVL